MDVRHFLDHTKCFQEIIDKIAELAADPCDAATESLSGFLREKDRIVIDKEAIPLLAGRALLYRGSDGVTVMGSMIGKVDGVILPNAILDSLWYASHGVLAPIRELRQDSVVPAILLPELSSETVAAAKSVFREFVVRAQSEQELFDQLTFFLQQNRLRLFGTSLPEETLRLDVFEIIRESSIKISRAVLAEFKAILGQELGEETYQAFLSQHPVLLDPLASTVLPKKPLGLEFKTDYVIKRLDGQYVSVEIEKPQDRLFTQRNDFSASFSHALGQVVDFLEWVDAHSEYARHHMPNISSPKGMLVMGMRSQLSKAQEAKLKRLSAHLLNIEVVTFDDLLQRGWTLYNNIHGN